MKAMLLVNQQGGNGHVVSHIDRIVNELHDAFETIITFVCNDKEEFKRHCIESCGNYDALIFAGGDGTFNLVINTLATQNNIPILGVLPTGTLCDAAKNFGIRKKLKKAIKIIKKGDIKTFDVVKINDEHFVFEASAGVYSDIPLKAKRTSKKIFGHFIYYMLALPEMMKMEEHKMRLIQENGEIIDIKTPFLLVMNSSHMAGFKINKTSNINDGLIDVFWTKKEIFNGLMSYFIFKKRVNHLSVSSLDVEVYNDEVWDVDGEKGPHGNASMKVIPNKFKIFYKNKNN